MRSQGVSILYAHSIILRCTPRGKKKEEKLNMKPWFSAALQRRTAQLLRENQVSMTTISAGGAASNFYRSVEVVERRRYVHNNTKTETLKRVRVMVKNLLGCPVFLRNPPLSPRSKIARSTEVFSGLQTISERHCTRYKTLLFPRREKA